MFRVTLKSKLVGHGPVSVEAAGVTQTSRFHDKPISAKKFLPISSCIGLVIVAAAWFLLLRLAVDYRSTNSD